MQYQCLRNSINDITIYYINNYDFRGSAMKQKGKLILTLILVGLTTLTTGCAQSSLTGTSYSRSEVRVQQHVQYGRIVSVMPVIIEGHTNGLVGAGTGAVIGGIAAQNIGGGSGRHLATVVGAVAGGIAGQRIEEAATRKQGFEYTVQLENGSTVSIVQEQDLNHIFSQGQRVKVLSQGNVLRVSI